jgi:hypothetical protein
MKTTKRKGGLVHKTTDRFRVIESKGRFYIECLADDCEPRVKRIGRKDVDYLMSCGSSFDAACVMDFGVGVFAKQFKPVQYV